MHFSQRKDLAYVVPFATFMAVAIVFQFLADFGLKLDNLAQPWYRRRPEYLMMLVQMCVCFPLLFYWRRQYHWNINSGWILGCLGGVIGIALWILPTHLYTSFDLGNSYEKEAPWFYEYLGLAERAEGFDAGVFTKDSVKYWIAIVLRFVRAVILVSLVEEIFWRGFLMKFVMKKSADYSKIAFGEHSWRSYFIVTFFFTMVHQPVDWLGAIIFGTIMYFVAIKTKSLFACFLMHFVANFLLGCYALQYSKFGLW